MIPKHLDMKDLYNRMRGKPKVTHYVGRTELVAHWSGQWTEPPLRKENEYLGQCMKCKRYRFPASEGKYENWAYALIHDRPHVSHGYCQHCAEEEMRVYRQMKAQRMVSKLVTAVLI